MAFKSLSALPRAFEGFPSSDRRPLPSLSLHGGRILGRSPSRSFLLCPNRLPNAPLFHSPSGLPFRHPPRMKIRFTHTIHTSPLQHRVSPNDMHPNAQQSLWLPPEAFVFTKLRLSHCLSLSRRSMSKLSHGVPFWSPPFKASPPPPQEISLPVVVFERGYYLLDLGNIVSHF